VLLLELTIMGIIIPVETGLKPVSTKLKIFNNFLNLSFP
jgi:hypothetical protein